jgi:Domain of unknown function (DUF4440)
MRTDGTLLARSQPSIGAEAMMDKKSFAGGVRGHATDDSTRAHGKSERRPAGVMEHLQRGRTMGAKTKELNKLAEDWAKAELDGDVGSLEEILAGDFVAVGPRGFVLTRVQWIDRHETGSLRYGSFGLDEAEIRSYGEAAIVVCRQTAAGVYEDDNGRYDIDESFRATLVFVVQDGGRRLAGLQLSPILGRP